MPSLEHLRGALDTDQDCLFNMQFSEFMNINVSSKDYFASVLVLIFQQLSLFSISTEESVFLTSYFMFMKGWENSNYYPTGIFLCI